MLRVFELLVCLGVCVCGGGEVGAACKFLVFWLYGGCKLLVMCAVS